MFRKVTAACTALAVLGSITLAASPASAQRWHRHHGWSGGAALGGFVAGAAIGSALARPYYAPYPGYTYVEPDYTVGAASGDDDAYCAQRFRSYDPASGTYLGYDGQRHPCP
jgi:hypothetical protein